MFYIVALHAIEPGHGVANRVHSDVAHVQIAGWIREHGENIFLGRLGMDIEFGGAQIVLPVSLDVVF